MDLEQVEQLVETKVEQVMRANNQELLSNITGMFNKISENSSTSANLLELPKFKRKSNEEQFKMNSKVISKLNHAETALVSENVESAKESLIEGNNTQFVIASR